MGVEVDTDQSWHKNFLNAKSWAEPKPVNLDVFCHKNSHELHASSMNLIVSHKSTNKCQKVQKIPYPSLVEVAVVSSDHTKFVYLPSLEHNTFIKAHL